MLQRLYRLNVSPDDVNIIVDAMQKSAQVGGVADSSAALIIRLCDLNVPPTDVTRVVAILSGQSQSMIEDGQLLQRLYSLNVSPDDMTVIVDTVQKSGVADSDAALIIRLCNLKVPPTDVTRVVAILSGNSDSTIEDAQLLQRLFSLNVSLDDINIIVDAMQKSALDLSPDVVNIIVDAKKRALFGGVAYRDPYVDPYVTVYMEAPPQYVKGK